MKNLVLSGGSIKGVTYVGVIKALYENIDFFDKIECFAGASIGSLFATILSLRIPLQNIEKFINLNFIDYFHLDIEDFVDNFGFDNGKRIMGVLGELMGEYKDITFKKAYEKTGKRLVISMTCMNNYEIEYFDYKTSPNIKILDAIRGSISIPFLFTAFDLNNKKYIDGAILETAPLSIFNPEDTLGVLIVDDEKQEHKYYGDFSSIEAFTYNFVVCIKRRIDNLNNLQGKYQTIKIKIKNMSFLDFGANIEKKNEIIQEGYNTMTNYIKSLKE